MSIYMYIWQFKLFLNINWAKIIIYNFLILYVKMYGSVCRWGGWRLTGWRVGEVDKDVIYWREVAFIPAHDACLQLIVPWFQYTSLVELLLNGRHCPMQWMACGACDTAVACHWLNGKGTAVRGSWKVVRWKEESQEAYTYPHKLTNAPTSVPTHYVWTYTQISLPAHLPPPPQEVTWKDTPPIPDIRSCYRNV